MAVATKWIWYHCYDSEGALKSGLSDLLAQFSSEEHEPLYEYLPNEEVCTIEDYEWHLAFDGLLYIEEVGRIYIVCSWGYYDSLPFKLKLPYSNNEAEYEACSYDLYLANKIRRLCAQQDSSLSLNNSIENLH